jgi:transglutaminase-like putative cysteine protease/tetratricopeptide (TPR) repeat protein
MQKLRTAFFVTILLFCIGPENYSQRSIVEDREAEWNQYSLPTSTFVRQTDPSKVILFRVPSEWPQQQTGSMEFLGPHGTTLSVIIETIPDGLPLREYVSSMLQQLRGVADSADSLVVRRTTMSATEAREILFETSDGSEQVTRRIIWTGINGPNAVILILDAPVTHVGEMEPIFKAVVQSLTFIEKYDFAGFDSQRSWEIKDARPVRVDEVQALVGALASLDSSTRQSNITTLAGIFASSPDTAIDLVLDGRPMVRAAAYEAISISRNNALERFLVRGLADREAFVAEKAARSIAEYPNVIEILRRQSFDWMTIESVARVWPFLSRNNQIKILNEAFAEIRIPTSPAINTSPKTDSTRGKPHVSVRAKVLSPGTLPPSLIIDQSPLVADPSRLLNGLALLPDLPVSDFKLPLATILTAKNDSLTLLALDIGWWRHDLLPVAELLKLLTSSNSEIRRLAALNLGQSGSVADIKSLESYLSKPPTANDTSVRVLPGSDASIDDGSSFDNTLQLVINRIRMREQIAAASGEERQQLIKKGLADPKLSTWVWYRYLRDLVGETDASINLNSQSESAAGVLPLGENLFPKDVSYYAAIPNPGVALEKITNALNGLQLESARSQANLVLFISAFRESLAQQLDSPPDTSPASYLGINFSEPIALANWYQAGAPRGNYNAERNAIIIRVTDRTRFERTLMLYQKSIGNFRDVTNYISGGVRLLTVIPGILPISAKAMLERPLATVKEAPLLNLSFVGATDWNGHSIKIFATRRVTSNGFMTTDAAYLTYIGDTALLAPNIDSIRDVLRRVTRNQETLATNPNFKRVAAQAGEAIYLSNVSELFGNPNGEDTSLGKGVISESGALSISNKTWENFYRIQFPEGDWLKPFIPFQPESLASPRELLPQSTVAYYFMNFDSVAAWRDWSNQLLGADERKALTTIWAIDFQKEVLPELGPECGVAALGLPNLLDGSLAVPYVVFFKLRSDKLARSLEAGTLFNSSSPSPGIVSVKTASGELFAVVRNQFFVFSTSRSAILALEHKEKLSASRDFSRAAKSAPADVVAFAGYNIEAAISAVGDSKADPFDTQISKMVSSLANAFHSPNFYATAASDSVQGRSSLSMDREGRFSVSELSSLSKDYRPSYAQVDARGVPIKNQERLSNLKLKIRAKAAGEIDRIRDDVSSPFQVVEKVSDTELVLNVLPRHSDPNSRQSLPINGQEFAPYLQPSHEIRSDDKTVIEKARSVAGEERDAWQVARKLADWTYKNITWKRVDYASAPQTLATLEADCLEFSQLYVAMARSLGLPARIVSGLAFSGRSFGGHAWVEVYVGEWIEVDPTWGTAFVDATHIRNSSDGALLTYAALNLVELEVLEAPRGIADYQKDPRTLAEQICREMSVGNLTALTSALDLTVLTNENPVIGTWSSLTESERDTMSAAYQRILIEITSGLQSSASTSSGVRLLSVKKSGEKAEAVIITSGAEDILVKLTFSLNNGAWFLTEMLQSDTDFHVISETLKPAIKNILDRRLDKSAKSQGNSDFVRILLIMQKDPAAAVASADRALKDDPTSQGLRHLKALCLLLNEKRDDAIQLWKELAGQTKPYAPALLYLGYQFAAEDDAEKSKLAIDYFIRYGTQEPDDPRTHVALARLYEGIGDDIKAEEEHKAALISDPLNISQFVEYSGFLALRKRIEEVAPVIGEAIKKSSSSDDPFGDLMISLYFAEDQTVVESVAKRFPERMETSANANLYLGYARIDNGKSLLSIPLLKKAVALKKDWSEPHVALARAYRTLRNWTAALNEADTAIRLDSENSDGHYQRACALSRLGRLNDALQSLEKAVEFDPEYVEIIEEEPDLRALASKPAFKKMLKVDEEPQP